MIRDGQKVKEVIHACWNIEDQKTKAREVKGLLSAMKLFRLEIGMILTDDYETEERIDGNMIRYVLL